MKSPARLYVLKLIKPASWQWHASQVPPPETAENQGFWDESFEFAASVGCLLPFLKMVDRSDWVKDLPKIVQYKMNERLHRELLFLALVNEQTTKVIDSLSKDRVPMLALGGVHNSRRLYPDRIYRPVKDVEIMIPRENLFQSLQRLGSFGLRLVAPHTEESVYAVLQRKPTSPPVKLCWQIRLGDAPAFSAGVWENALDGDLAGFPREVKVPAMEDAIVYHVRRGAVENELRSILWFNDLHLMVEQAQGIDWERVIWRMAEQRALSAFWFALNLLANEWHTVVPRELMTGVGERVGSLRRRVLSNVGSKNLWFSRRTDQLPWMVSKRYLLGDSTWNSFRYGLRNFVTRLVR